MTWRNICPMDEKIKFIAEIKAGNETVSNICHRYGISRKTGYKWLRRYEELGPSGLYERSRARATQEQTPSVIIDAILEAKARFTYWGPRKIKAWLESEFPERNWPAASTIGNIFKKEGLTVSRKRRISVPAYTRPFSQCVEPNDVWSADFKGQFKTGDKLYCYPLTVSDNFSRFIITCSGYLKPNYDNVKKGFIKAFQMYGLPKAIKTDNGSPFATVSPGGLSKLSMWWLKLGIQPERIEPGHPEQNGRHERMHRSLKQATAIHPKADLRKQNKRFNEFVHEYNYLRPHEALGNKKPAQVYTGSGRPYPSKLSEITYASDLLVRKVRSNGEIKFKGHLIYVSELLYGEPVGLCQTDEGVWDVMYSSINLGVLNERKHSFARN